MSTPPATLTAADVEHHTREVFDIWASLDPDRITALYSGGVGFGYRTRDARPAYPTSDAYRDALRSWLGWFDYYRIGIDELETAADGDVGLAWGFYSEEFQLRGGTPQVTRGRFSEVMKRDASGWRTLLYHRDAQEFDGGGRHIPPVPDTQRG